jgi:hypothetical protein
MRQFDEGQQQSLRTRVTACLDDQVHLPKVVITRGSTVGRELGS